MHPRLRRLLSATQGAPTLDEWSAFVEAVSAELHAADREREKLRGSVKTLTALLHDEQQAHAPPLVKKPAKRGRKLAAAREASGVATFVLTPDLIVKSANPAAVRLCGAPSELVGQHFFSLIEPLEPETVVRRWAKHLDVLEPVAETLACSAAGKPGLACDFVCVPRARRSGRLSRVVVYVRDQTQRVELEAARREREERLSLALGQDIVWDLDARAGTLYVSPRFRELTGIAALTPAEWFERVHPEDGGHLRSALAAVLEGRAARLDNEHRVKDAGGDWRWIWVRGAAQRDPTGAVRAAGLMTDVTRHRTIVERMAHDARHDALTRLPNRTFFLDILRHSFRRIRRHESYKFAVLFIDLDDFKKVNDTLGHEAGDQLLVQIGKRLESCLRAGDTLARHAGDEFTMWLDDVRSERDALRVAARVHEVMREPFRIGARHVESSASIGIAVGSSAYAQAEEVLRDADQAMYRAKALGKGRTAVYEKAHVAPDLEADLREALGRNELRVLYMPIVDLGSGRVEGLEALARWQHPRLGLVSPAQFLSLAERSGIITSIDRWVLETASRQLHAWRRELKQAGHTSISVNFSKKALEEEGLAAHVAGVLSDARLAPSDVSLDISEGSTAARGLAELHQKGVRLHMDDFGTGQGWLRHLHSGELDSVKIDRSFVGARGGEDRAVLRHMVSIARELGKSVIAEGVETAEHLQTVREVGCDAAQGFLFGAPLDAAQARSLLEVGRVS